MSVAGSLARQLAEPTGLAGRAIGAAMDIANRRPTRLAIDLLAPMDEENILDAGCGTGAAMAEVLRRAHCRLVGIDRSVAMVAAAERRLGPSATVREARIEDLPFPAQSFHAVIALNIFYFCDPDSAMICTLRRVLRPEGRLVAYVTHRDTMRNWSFTREGYHRLFDEEALVSAIMAGGFARDGICVETVTIARGVKGLLALARC